MSSVGTEDVIDETHDVADDWAIIIPAGIWHNAAVNTGGRRAQALLPTTRRPSICDGTVHRTKAKAEAEEAEHG